MADAIKKIVINSTNTLIDFVKLFFELYREHRYLVVSLRIGRDRSLEQNALWAAMYVRIGKVLEWSFDEARAHCKWYLGMPILRRDYAGFDLAFKKTFWYLTTEEECLSLMNSCTLYPVDGFPVTRNFSRKQGAEYTDAIIKHFAEQNVIFDDLLEGNNQ